MPMPLSQDYNEAIQNPQSSFSDAELKTGQAVTNALGLPVPCSGNFADVYALQTPQRKWAVKCFTREIPGIRERYIEVSKYLQQLNLPFMVEFKFIDQGIRVRNQWYPVLKMHWVEGFTLNQFVRDNVDKPQLLQTMCQIWVKLAARLKDGNMAHCDLQHGNVMLVPSKQGSLGVRLVDYDGMFVPALEFLKTIEVGHPAYQHPQRLKEGYYGVEVDRVPHLVIYTALKALQAGGKTLWSKFDNGDNMLFRQQDLAAPGKSPVFAELAQHKDPEVRRLTETLAGAVGKPIAQAPLLTELVPDAAVTKIAMPARTVVAPTAAAPTQVQNVFASAVADSADRPARASEESSGAMKWLAVGGTLLAVAILGVGAFLVLGNKSAKTSPFASASTPTTQETFKETTQAKVETKIDPKLETKIDPKLETKIDPKVIATQPGVPRILPIPDVFVQPGSEAIMEIQVDRAGVAGNLDFRLKGTPPGVKLEAPTFQGNKVLVKVVAPPGTPPITRQVQVNLSLAGQVAQGEVKITVMGAVVGKEPPAGQAKEVLRYAMNNRTGMQRIAASADGRLLLGVGNRLCILWDAGSGKLLHELTGHTNLVMGSALSPDGKRAITGGMDGSLRVWDTGSGQELRQKAQAHPNGIMWIVCSPDGRRLLTGGRDNRAKLWELETLQEVATLAGHQNMVNCVAFSPDGKQAATASWDRTVKLWDLTSGKELHLLTESGMGQVQSVAWSPDGKHVVSGGGDAQIRLWDAGTGQRVRGFPTSPGIWCLAFAADSKRFLACGQDGTARLWDINTGQLVGSASGSPGMTAAVWLADGHIATGGLDGSVIQWDLSGTAVAFKPPDTTAKPPDTTTKPPDTTTKPPDTTTKPPDTTTKPPDKPPVPAIERVAIPDAAKLAAAEKTVKDVYNVAKIKLADRPALAAKMIQAAQDTADNPADRYVLLREARDIAIAAGAIETALQAVDKIDERYLIDVLDMKVTTLIKLGPAQMPAAGNKLLAEQCLETAEDAMAADKYDQAISLLKLVEVAAKRAAAEPLIAQSRTRQKAIGETQKEYEKIKVLSKTLEDKPDDPAANLAVGRFLCFHKGDFDKGLPMLAKGSDANLQGLAKKDLALPNAAEGQVEMADAWWDLAETASATIKPQLQRRALHWYQQAKPNLTGLVLEKVDKRIAQLETTASAPSVAQATAEVRRLNGHTGKVNGVAFSADGKQAISAGADRSVRVWEVGTGKELFSMTSGSEPTAIAWSPDGKTAAAVRGVTPGAAFNYYIMTLYDMDNRREQRSNSFTNELRGIAFAGNAKVIFADGRYARLYQVAGGSSTSNVAPKNSTVSAVAASADGRFIAYGTADGAAHFREPDAASPRTYTVTFHTMEVVVLALNRLGTVGVTASADRTARAWNTASGQALGLYKGHTAAIRCVALSPDGRYVFSAGDDKSIRMWEASTGKLWRSFAGHTDAVTGLAVSPDGKQVLSSSADGTLRLWSTGR